MNFARVANSRELVGADVRVWHIHRRRGRLAVNPPALHIQAHRAHGQDDADLLSDQFADVSTCPQGGGDAPWFGLMRA